MEDKIRKLCSDILTEIDDDVTTTILIELREALHEHIERLRTRFCTHPVPAERRARK